MWTTSAFAHWQAPLLFRAYHSHELVYAHPSSSRPITPRCPVSFAVALGTLDSHKTLTQVQIVHRVGCVPVDVVAGGFRTAVLFSDGSVMTTGLKGVGGTAQGDDSGDTKVLTPVASFGVGARAARVTMGLNNIALLTATGSVFLAGDNSQGMSMLPWMG